MIGLVLNGYTVVAAQPASHGDHYVILGVNTRDTGHAFVTALVHTSQMPTPTEWWSGHYIQRGEAAVDDYFDRAITRNNLAFLTGVDSLTLSLANNEWVHTIGGTPCTGEVSEELPNIGICVEHDQRVRRRVPR